MHVFLVVIFTSTFFTMLRGNTYLDIIELMLQQDN